MLNVIWKIKTTMHIDVNYIRIYRQNDTDVQKDKGKTVCIHKLDVKLGSEINTLTFCFF